MKALPFRPRVRSLQWGCERMTSAADADSIPVILSWLHDGEELLRAESLKTIETSAPLKAHVTLVTACMNLIDYYARQFVETGDDQLIVQKLGARPV